MGAGMNLFGPESKTQVVNIRLEKCDVKICRLPDNSIPPPPNGGCFGNPYPLAKCSREDAIRGYRAYFMERVESDPEFRKAVLGLRGKRLGCFCKQPDREVACHGDVIVEWLESNLE